MNGGLSEDLGGRASDERSDEESSAKMESPLSQSQSPPTTSSRCGGGSWGIGLLGSWEGEGERERRWGGKVKVHKGRKEFGDGKAWSLVYKG